MKTQTKAGWLTGLWFLCLFVLPLALYLYLRSQSFEVAFLFANFYLFWAFKIIAILPHELSHAFVGRRLGLFVDEVSVGRGREMFSATLMGFEIRFRAMPLVGYVKFRHVVGGGLRKKYFLTILAGPAIHVLLAASAYPFLHWEFDFTHGIAVGQVLFISQAVMALANLTPYRSKFAPSDGLSLLQLLFSKTPEVLGPVSQFHFDSSTNKLKLDSTITRTGTLIPPSQNPKL